MNWTGGSLQRHSKANANAVLKRQKENFAKARLRLRPQQPRIMTLTPSARRSNVPSETKLRQTALEPSIDVNSGSLRSVHDSHSPPEASLTGAVTPKAALGDALQDPGFEHDA
jgi:hypothetical protein